MTGWKDWQIGEVVTESDFQSFVQDQVVQRYADASARTSALGTAVAEGMVSYLEDTNRVEVYDGTAWTDFSGDITGITAGTGLTGGGTAGAVTLSADYAAIGSAITVDQDQVTGLTSGTSGYTALSNGTAGITYQPVSHNYIINGAFDIWQRGTGTFTTNTGYTADRWQAYGAGAFAVTQQPFSVGDVEAIGFGDAQYFLRFDVTTGAAFSKIIQRIEDVRTLANQPITVSFWAKGTNPSDLGAMTLFLNQNFGSGGSAGVSNNQQFTLTNSWQRYSLTFNLASIAGKTIGTNSNLVVEFNVGNSTQTATIDIWGVQLEAGSVATPFKRHAPDVGLEEESANRYYQQNTIPAGAVGVLSPYGAATNSTTALIPFSLKTNLRDTPTEINFANLKLSDGITSFAVTALTIWNRSNSKQSYLVATVASGLTTNRPYFLEKNITADEAKLGIGREL